LVQAERHIYAKTTLTFNVNTNKIVSKEWKLMNDTVPDRIYFRGYTDRMDLQRWVVSPGSSIIAFSFCSPPRFLIIGAAGTIYYNSYFLFDMQLPANYPQSPPSVLMHAFNYRINPNLYAEGKVCCTFAE